ncbi:GNAT family N-acetyltransferase [Acinetobacter sp. ANC 4558]|uniref:GNAT family N-acetyltransferase n=1 Tax=Acinetobacter sp. ANC 4558 TaxID=1977876 RepID=UPI000A3492E7|nr:GNAT family N-acetyltransferase [Acinetobacter sp. ANC 4558]OTG80806.1 GNAT family N-acetyltransferase [Acinetobacter sp. ANC 4558]
MQVRVATLGDVPAIIQIARQFILEAPNYSNRELSEESLTKNLQAVINGSGAVVLAERQSKVVGGIVCLTSKDWFNDELIAFEQVFYVDPKFRSSRAPFLLLEAFIRWSKLMKANRIQCGTTTKINTKGCLRLYERFGFREYGVVFDMELKHE